MEMCFLLKIKQNKTRLIVLLTSFKELNKNNKKLQQQMVDEILALIIPEAKKGEPEYRGKLKHLEIKYLVLKSKFLQPHIRDLFQK